MMLKLPIYKSWLRVDPKLQKVQKFLLNDDIKATTKLSNPGLNLCKWDCVQKLAWNLGPTILFTYT